MSLILQHKKELNGGTRLTLYVWLCLRQIIFRLFKNMSPDSTVDLSECGQAVVIQNENVLYKCVVCFFVTALA